MEVFEGLGIKIPNAVLVDGPVEESSSEVIDFLDQYGDINRDNIINDSESEFNHMLVVEFASGASLAKLSSRLPYTFISDKNNEFHIKNLSQIYTSKLGGSKTDTYLSDLKEIAKMSGKDYSMVLGEMMSQIQQAIAQLHPIGVNVPKMEQKIADQPKRPPEPSVPPPVPSRTFGPVYAPLQTSLIPPASASHSAGMNSTGGRSIAPGDLNPPEVQRYVVEHVVRSSDTSMYATHRLRPFSGKVPRSTHEMDYDTWRSGVELVLRDPAISDLQRTKLIRDSLLPPACDMVKHLSHDALPDVYLQQLESAYGTVQDGEELYAKFMDTYQNHGEKPSEYLQRLQVALQCAVRRGGVSERDMDKRLLAQFCRGCWDNGLISELQLKQRKSSPPSFAELLLLLRTEEDREATKEQRMKQHLGGTKQKVTTHAQFVNRPDEELNLCTAITNFTKELSQQMTVIQQQLAALNASQANRYQPVVTYSASKQSETGKTGRNAKLASSNPKPGFCFRCGEDGHIKPQCDSDPNPILVSAKKKQFQDRQQKWQRQNSSEKNHLN